MAQKMQNHGSKFLLLPIANDVGRVMFVRFVFVYGLNGIFSFP